MMKRTLSFLLCLIMVLGAAAPAVQASGTDGVLTSGNIMDNIHIENDSNVDIVFENTTVSTPEIEKLPNPSDLVSAPPLNFGAPVPQLPAEEVGCKCVDLASAVEHSGICTVKAPYMKLCEASVEELFAKWESYAAEEQDFLLDYLYEAYPTKYLDLVKLLTAPTGSASEILTDGTTVSVEGIPQDGTLTVGEADDEVKNIVDAYVAEKEESASALFGYDVSVQDGAGADWQPDVNVKLELELPGAKLHKYSKVYVVHVDDEGNATTIEAKVTEEGKIAFETPGFSAFYGFTVDFHYEDATFCIPGTSSIKLSELFENLKMPLNAEDVADVEYTDDTQLKIEKLEGDWLLTSLKAFTTEEKLTLTMSDGAVYEVKVTDAIPYPSIYYAGYGNQDEGNGTVQWYISGSSYGYAYSSASGGYYGDGWTEDWDIYVDGTNAINKDFEIVLQRRSGVADGTALNLDLHTVRVVGGANLTIRLGSSITNDNTPRVNIRQVAGYVNENNPGAMDTRELFWVEDGSLTIRPNADYHSDVRMWIYTISTQRDTETNYDTGKPYTAATYVSLRENATSFYADQCNFLCSANTALVSRAKELERLELNDCTFGRLNTDGTIIDDNRCVNKTGQGGAMYLRETVSDDSTTPCHIQELILTDVGFYGAEAKGGSGGAIHNRGSIGTFTMTRCTFMECKAYSHGGAISLRNLGNSADTTVSVGSLSMSECTFTDCTAGARAGAARLSFTDATPVTIQDCTFTNCDGATISGAITIENKVGNVSVTGSVTGVTGAATDPYTTYFVDCDAGSGRGGGMSILCSEIGNVTFEGVKLENNVAATMGGGIYIGNQGSPAVSAGYVTFNKCYFANNESKGGLGGGIGIADCPSYDYITVSSCTFEGCIANNFGGAIAMKVYAENQVTDFPFGVEGDINILDCSFSKCRSGSMGAEAYEADGKTPITWDHDENPSTPEIDKLNGTGGGGAIALGGDIGGKVVIKGSIDKPMRFQDCTTWNNGAAVYFNTAMTVKGVTAEDGTKETITLQYLDIEKCFSRDAGGGVYVSSIVADAFDFSDSSIRNCGFFDLTDSNFTALNIAASEEILATPTVYKADGSTDTAATEALRTKLRTKWLAYGNDLFVAYDASGTFRSIGNTSTVATLTNILFKENKSYSNGGAVYWNANRSMPNPDGSGTNIDPKLYLNNCIFDGNHSQRSGGGVYCESNIMVTACLFERNFAALRGGGIAQQIYSNNARTFTEGEQTSLILDKDTLIADNTSLDGGGIAIVVNDTISMPEIPIKYPLYFQLNGATVRNNHATQHGGGIFYETFLYEEGSSAQANVDHIQKKIILDNGIVHGNISGVGATMANGKIGHGGGIYMNSNQIDNTVGYSEIEVTGASIYDNVATIGNGGGIYLTGTNAVCSVKGGAIGAQLTKDAEGNDVLTPGANTAYNRRNGVHDYTGGVGGGIAIFGGARIEMEGGYIVSNLAYTAGGGVAVHGGSTMYLHDGYIDGNEASLGGGISLNGAVGDPNATDEKLRYGMFFDGGIVRNNVASINQDKVAYGGGICISNSATMKLAGGEVSGNKAESIKGTSTYAEGQEGGGIAVCQNSHMLLEGGLIKDNHAYDGGGIVIRGHSSMEMNPVTNQVDGEAVTTYGVIDNNEAQHWGGAIYIVDAVDYTKPNALVIDGGIIKNNRALTQNGGGIYLGRSNTLTISGGDIHNNYSATWGGGIYARASRLDLLGGNIHHNQAEMEGGAICLQSRAFANINGSKIFSNTAQQGAGVFSTWSSFAIASGELYSNVASDKGGAIYMIGECTVNITGGKINNNSAPSGGGIYAEINGGAKPQVKIDGGIFTSNSATSANGGAVYLNNCDTVISEGTFDTNTASWDGGALCAIGGTLEISGGSFTTNVASMDQGGAMYIDGCNTTMSDGTFNDNAGRYGGGMFVNRSTVNFTGGKFTNNKSNQGGGIFIRSSTVNISNITVSGNVAGADDRYITDNAAYQYGGGLFIDSGSGVASAVTVNSGEFTNNRATHGGGIWIANRSSNLNYTNALTINGGNITNNTATYNGGGILIGGGGLATEDVENNGVITPGKYTSLIMNGGYIARNTAGGNGGGIYADGRAKVFIKGTEAAHGEISFNTANNGGGIYVTTGANLTVTDGYIIKNTAVEPVGSSGLQTAKGNDAQLYGTGGGICVTAGTDAARSTFTLSGDNVAIYGNTATFAADDVFSSGTKTELLVPKVTVMNLAGYGFNPEGWVEDYATTDTAYTSGLNMIGVYAAASSGAAAEMIEKTPVLRYRNAVATQRRYMLIKPEYVIGETEEGTVITDEYANKPDAYVCMTLGIPTAMDDTVVFDYGSEILVNVWMNDLFLDADTSEGGDNDFGCDDSIIAKDEGTYIGHSFTIGTTDGTVREFEDSRYIPITPNTQPLFVLRRTGLYGASGVVYSGGNGTFSYTPNKINISKEDSFFYAAAHNGFWYYANMHVVPATTLYFEDNAHVGQQLFINYHTESSNMTLAPWTTETAGQNAYFRQDEDRPGDDQMSGVDADNIYGYDGTYAYSTKYSNGSASKVIVSRIDEDTTVNARATFTFTGTGFDIISFCSANTGLVSVSVYKGTEDGIIFEDDPTTPDVWDATTPIATYMVDTQYQTGSGIYQVPVIKADLNQVKVYDKDWNWTGDYYGYGTYTVEIYVAPGWLETDPGYNRCEFYLDAIRIYNPAGINGSNSQMAEDAYKADNEQWPVYQELRNLFLSDKELTSETAMNGILFIDGSNTPSIKEYITWGPNNEIYLDANQAVTFTLNPANYGGSVDKVHLAMRGLTGSGNVLVQASNDANAAVAEILNKQLSATDMYYDITEAMGKVLVIKNNGTTPVAISTLKVTHTQEPAATNVLSDIVTTSLEDSLLALEIFNAEQLAEITVTPKRPALSFNGMVCYNVFFDAQDLGDLTAADLGLAVFNTYAPDGTVENANEVHLGAEEIDGLYMVATDGVHAKYLGDTKFFRAFAKKADGSYVYSKMVSYSAVDYAKNILAKSDDVKLKQLVVAMLNYGAEAQKFFGYKTYDLMNKDLTADDLALLNGFDANSLNKVGKVNASKVGAFASTGGFTKRSPAISFKGAFEINYFMTPAYAVDGDMTMYFWTEDTYNSVTELTADNADKAVVMTPENGSYTACSDEIIAKYLDKTVYVAAVYESNGVTYCSGVLPYSIAAYCQKPPASVQDLATAAAIYGCTAKQYFGV